MRTSLKKTLQPLKLNNHVSIFPLENKHAQDMFRWVSDPSIAQRLGLRRRPSLEKTTAWIEQADTGNDKFGFAVYLRKKHVGIVNLDRLDDHVQSARLSVYIGEITARQQGVATTAIHKVLQFAFEEKKLNKVWLIVHPSNYEAVSLYERLGFIKEGILRDEFVYNDHRDDAIYMGLLKSEFRSSKSETISKFE